MELPGELIQRVLRVSYARVFIYGCKDDLTSLRRYARPRTDRSWAAQILPLGTAERIHSRHV